MPHQARSPLLTEALVRQLRLCQRLLQAARVRNREMRRFKPVPQAQGFVIARAVFHNLFNLRSHLSRAQYYRDPGSGGFGERSRAAACDLLHVHTERFFRMRRTRAFSSLGSNRFLAVGGR